MFDVITIGSAVQDVFVTSRKFTLLKSPKFSTGVGECFALGSKINIDNIVFDTGGGATNAAVTFRRAGLKTSIVTKIGDDISGEAVMRALKKEKIDTRHVVVDAKQTTGYSVILTAGEGDRSILTYRGVAADLRERDISFSKLKTRWFYVTSLAGNIALLRKIVSFSEKHGVKVFLNPGGAELKQRSFLKKMIRRVDVLSFNTEEAAVLLDLDFSNKKKLVDGMAALTNNTVLLTDGPDGTFFIDQGKRYSMPTTGKKSVNATGAGDAFGSGFLAGYILRNDFRFALRLGLYNAEGVIQKIGAKNGIFTKVPSFLRKPTIKEF
ncbi:MAG TPA: carbohydrate kinase family protein [Patescibacteria group bacterium]|nr:carbohydrate kinase family protein [Patescibacteria group bacterium]